jgi:hypothetical protein
MTSQRAKLMDQRSFGRSCTAGGRLMLAARGFLGTRQNDSVPFQKFI